MSVATLSHPGPKPDKLLFLKKFIKHGKRVASFAPSSRALASAMCDAVSSDVAQTIVELGAGTGAVTQAICKKMHPGSRLIAVEIDPTFAAHLRHSCPTAEVVVADVLHLRETLTQCGIRNVDVILNGLPTPSLPKSLNHVVLQTFADLAPTGVFSQLTVMPWVYKPTYDRLFHDVDFSLVMKNVPPGGVYHCRGLRASWRDAVPGVEK